MENMGIRDQIVSDVLPGSPAQRAGVRKGERLLSIDGEPVKDLIDYEYLTAGSRLKLIVSGLEGETRTVRIRKDACEPLGLSFATSLMSPMRTCRNHCVFCFIDQMPKGGRTSLHVKDDDWRMSFIMGNYVSLTNVDDAELDRIIARRVSPLYVSLHATDGEVRQRMMANPRAAHVMEQLNRLKAAGLTFHLQVVLCPGINDGAVLDRTLGDVETLLPAVKSLAIVPVGLTRSRENLYPIRGFTRDEAAGLIDRSMQWQATFLKSYGTRLVFLSDEWYFLGNRPLPPEEAYEEFPQIENGVGLIRRFEREMEDALAEENPLGMAKAFTVAGGVSAAGYFAGVLPERLRPYGVELTVLPVENRYFGGNVTVTGLLTGSDLIAQLTDKLPRCPLLLPGNMLREKDDVFLDNLSLSALSQALNRKVIPFYDGEDFVRILFHGEEI